MNSDYLFIDGHRCYIGDKVGFTCNVIVVSAYAHDEAIKVAEKLKERLNADGYTLSRLGYPVPTGLGREVIAAEYGITIKGVRMEEIMKWQ